MHSPLLAIDARMYMLYTITAVHVHALEDPWMHMDAHSISFLSHAPAYVYIPITHTPETAAYVTPQRTYT